MVDILDFSFNTPSEIIFGAGKISDIGKAACKLGSKALLVTGRKFLKECGYLNMICESLRNHDIDFVLHDVVPPEPLLNDVSLGIGKCISSQCDFVIGVGGGSSLDVAKTIAAIAGKEGCVTDYFYGKSIADKGLPFIAIPTTAGSGSESTPNAVLIDPHRNVKSSIRSKYMIADLVIVDPEILLSLSPQITAYSGMDSLTQAIEAFVSIGENPVTSSLSARSVELLINNLIEAFRHGNDLRIKTNIALGSLMSGIAFGNARLGLVHGMAHPLGVLSHLPHGLICGLLLPVVMEFNRDSVIDKYAYLARYCGLASEKDSDETSYICFINHIRSMNKTMELDDLREMMKPSYSEWKSIIDQTMISGSTKSNPRKVCESDVKEILCIIDKW